MSVRLANLFLGRGFAALFACLVCVGCESSPPPASVSTGQPNKTPSVQIKDDQTVAVVPDKPDQSADDNQPGKVTQPTSPATDDAEDMPDDPGDNTAEPTETADGAAPTEPYVPESLAIAEEKLLVDAADLTRLDPESNVWVDKKNKRVVLAGEVCRRDSILEMFACLKGTKEHEAIVSVHCKAFLVHTGLLLVGAEPGHPVRFQPEYAPVEGPEIEITVLWHDEEGKLQEARAQDWIRNRKTGEALTAPFVFGGSGFWTNDKTGDQYYLAEGGDLICVSNFSSALMDLPIESSDHQGAELFEPFTDRIPAEKTAVTLLLTPQPPKQEPAEEAPTEKATDNAEPDAAKEPDSVE